MLLDDDTINVYNIFIRHKECGVKHFKGKKQLCEPEKVCCMSL